MKNMTLVVVAAACAAVVSIDAQSGRPTSGRAMTIDDLITSIRVTEPQLSADGTHVAYVRTVTDGKTGRRNADIWRLPADGSAPPRLLAGGDSAELTPTFSPDGKHVAFISTRSGAPQVFLATADGQDVRPLTKLAMGVQTPLVFSPDSTRVAFVSDVYPGCADESCNARRADEAEKNPVKVHHVKRLLFRHWSDWREELRHHIFVTDTPPGTRSTSRRETSIRRPSSTKTTALRSHATANRSPLCRTAKAATRRPGRPTTTCGSCPSPAAAHAA